MKTSLWGAMIASLSVAEGVKDRMSFVYGADEVEFNLDTSTVSVRKPYRVVFFHAGNRSLFKFNAAGQVTDIKVDLDSYKVKYDSDGELKDVIATSPTLKEVRDHTENRTGVYDCEVCEEAYDIVCNEGVASVCKLDDYGSPIRGVPSTSIEIMCATFGQACSNTFSARKACKGQCKETEGITRCLDPTSREYKCGKTDNRSLRMISCELVDEDWPLLPACFESFGKSDIQTLDFTDNKFTTLPDDPTIFEGLPNLDWLDIQYNPMDTLPEEALDSLESLRTLYLTNTNITSIPEGFFSGTPNLESLIIFENKLAGLPPNVFKGLPDLSTVSMDANELTTLPATLFEDNSKMFAVAYEKNPGLQCVPPSTALYVETSDDFVEGELCECAPEGAVMCDAGEVCTPGLDGYNCGPE